MHGRVKDTSLVEHLALLRVWVIVAHFVHLIHVQSGAAGGGVLHPGHPGAGDLLVDVDPRLAAGVGVLSLERGGRLALFLHVGAHAGPHAGAHDERFASRAHGLGHGAFGDAGDVGDARLGGEGGGGGGDGERHGRWWVNSSRYCGRAGAWARLA